MADVVQWVHVAALTGFQVDPDGDRVRFHALDHEGASAILVLPAECLNQLLMTLPRIIQESLRKGHGDDSLRLVYPLEQYKLELGDISREGIQQFILGLQTPDGFSVSFAASADVMVDMARSIFSDVVAHPSTERRCRTCS